MQNLLKNPIDVIGEAILWIIEMFFTISAILGSPFLGGVIGKILTSEQSFTVPIIVHLIAIAAVIAWAQIYVRKGIQDLSEIKSTLDDENTKEALLDALIELADEEKIEVRRKE